MRQEQTEPLSEQIMGGFNYPIPAREQTEPVPERPGFIIKGITNNGFLFHPIDWAEQLHSRFITFGSWGEEHYFPYVAMSFIQDIVSLVVEPDLWEVNPEGYEFLSSFAKQNDLAIVERELIPPPVLRIEN